MIAERYREMTAHMVSRLDRYAEEYGVTRQSLVKIWLAERLNEEDDRRARRHSATG